MPKSADMAVSIAQLAGLCWVAGRKPGVIRSANDGFPPEHQFELMDFPPARKQHKNAIKRERRSYDRLRNLLTFTNRSQVGTIKRILTFPQENSQYIKHEIFH